MQYRKLGRTGLGVSELCLGTMQFGWTTDEATSFRAMDVFVEAGGNFVDTADFYTQGTSEEIIGRWLKARGNRSQVILATKVGLQMWDGPNGAGLSRAHIVTAVEDSLRRLQTDYVDLYYAHRPWYDGDPEETLRVFDELVQSGKARYVACSNYPAWWLMKSLWISDAHRWARFVCVQPKYNLLFRAEFERELLAACEDQGLGVVPYSPQAAGVLTGKYRRGGPEPSGPRVNTVKSYLSESAFVVVDKLSELARARHVSVAQIALAWVLTRPGITSAIAGVNTPDQLQESLGAVGLGLTPEEMAELDTLTEWHD
jgi:aryl-alcohol dehydrogenase-like predicted oxidoreductase